MASEDMPGGFDFEQIRRMLEQMGLGGAGGELDLNALMARMQASGVAGLGMTNADRDPDAAWRTTITKAAQLARAKGPDPEPDQAARARLVDAERLAQSWLSEQISFPETGLPPELLRRSAWLVETGDRWRELVQPIIEGLGDALKRGATVEDEPELGALTSMLEPLMRTSASLIYRERLAAVLAELACDTLTGTEVGVNLLPRAQVALVPANLAAVTKDLELPESDVELHLLVREAARQRLFHHVGWLSPQLTALLAHYAREINIDFDAISATFDPSNLQELSLEHVMQVGEQVRGSFFKPASTPVQLEILGRLETLLALIEGWVDHVTARATARWMPNAAALGEVVRRRRASNGAAQRVFSDLLGLELSPRLVRDAENLWASLEHTRAVAGRDAVWNHPDVLPTAEHLADPLSYTGAGSAPSEPDDLDDELRKLLGGEGR